MILIPYNQLEPDTLTALIEAFVNREGTDYGESEQALASKVAAVKNQLAQETALVVFDEASESVNIMSKAEFAQAQLEHQAQSQIQDEREFFNQEIPIESYDDGY